MYSIEDYRFVLPDDQIAQYPAEKRDLSKLLVLDKTTGNFQHLLFRDIQRLLNRGDLVVINNTKVVPARIRGRKATGGKIELLILDYAQGIEHLRESGAFQCQCLVKASISPRTGSSIFFEKNIEGVVIGVADGIFEIRFSGGKLFLDFLARYGDIPLPPYIKRRNGKPGETDAENYQTVYAEEKGAVAAPTAGLHFTRSLMKKLRASGVEFAAITLHVGYGTFVPVRVKDIRGHVMHSEYISVNHRAAAAVNRARTESRRVIAVGTTTVRTLEFMSDANGMVQAGSGMCDLFIYPGYRFKCTDAVITNFHLPESTLLMLVSAFAGRKNILTAYQSAVENDYRFFSYGDAMLIL